MSQTAALPLGLTRAGLPTGGASELPELAYDPIRQISLTRNGIAAIDDPAVMLASTPCDTKHDNQWFVDQDD
ncbi:hypothetical protein FHR81_000953 [Actinoalloteichus hoggarensis]|uniref:Uncharacterized protein n=1 Tax=Actinoalloteichus hoggarensis TaxID=1470176 RepID=A0A221VZH6_9PSEU|nr:hypothetical protein [Actinoalloteichus hoggarensis]ASO18691.1 hypothetical protein AHOG_05190 [Actinoalloteichus hoggarensis]MBB5919923.1 hypothetical protein [Actinoalloteichus hoggarensis]